MRRSFSKPLEHFETDVAGTVSVLEACRLNSVSQIVFASSSVVYGNARIPTSEEAPTAPISNYGAAKAASEHYVFAYCELSFRCNVCLALMKDGKTDIAVSPFE